MDDDKWDYPVEHWPPMVGSPQLLKCRRAPFFSWRKTDHALIEEPAPTDELVPVVAITQDDEIGRQFAKIRAEYSKWLEDVKAGLIDINCPDEPAPEPECATPEPPSHRYIPDPDLVDPAVDVMAMVRRFS